MQQLLETNDDVHDLPLNENCLGEGVRGKIGKVLSSWSQQEKKDTL